jgi:type IV secretory pathway VirB2 component (pilin)
MLLNFKKILIISIIVFSTSFLLCTESYAVDGGEGQGEGQGKGQGKSTNAGDGIAQVLCNVIEIAQGATGKTIATLVIISMAIGLFLGKITWGVAIAVAVGMGVLFGANTVVGFLADGSNGDNNVCNTLKVDK